jgi:hypothetical protein
VVEAKDDENVELLNVLSSEEGDSVESEEKDEKQ